MCFIKVLPFIKEGGERVKGKIPFKEMRQRLVLLFGLRGFAFPPYFLWFSLMQRTSLCQEGVQDLWNYADKSAMESLEILASILKTA